MKFSMPCQTLGTLMPHAAMTVPDFRVRFVKKATATRIGRQPPSPSRKPGMLSQNLSTNARSFPA